MAIEKPVIGSLGWGEKLNNNFTEIEESLSTLDSYIKKDSIMNSISIATEGYVLDARQGKRLYDDGLYYKGNIEELGVTNFNEIVEAGIYLLGNTTIFNNTPNINKGVLICYKITGTEYVVQQAIEISSNIIKQRTGYESSLTTEMEWSDWKRISSTTNIADVEKTSATLSNSMGTYNYYIKDGICTVEFKDIAGETSDLILAETSNLPIPVLSKTGILENNGIMVGSITVSGNGKITCHKNSSNLGYGSITYQIDEEQY